MDEIASTGPINWGVVALRAGQRRRPSKALSVCVWADPCLARRRLLAVCTRCVRGAARRPRCRRPARRPVCVQTDPDLAGGA